MSSINFRKGNDNFELSISNLDFWNRNADFDSRCFVFFVYWILVTSFYLKSTFSFLSIYNKYSQFQLSWHQHHPL